jgi:DNA-binding NarL/FixJ family response regulator
LARMHVPDDPSEIIRQRGDYSAPLRVLIVGDEKLFRWAVREALEAAGFVVDEASASVAAVHAAIDRATPDVVVIGPAMESQRQLDLLRECRLAPDAALVAMTGERSRESRFDILRAGATQVVGDAVDIADIPAIVAEANRQRRL